MSWRTTAQSAPYPSSCSPPRSALAGLLCDKRSAAKASLPGRGERMSLQKSARRVNEARRAGRLVTVCVMGIQFHALQTREGTMERSCLRAGLLVPLALAFAAPGLADVRVTNQVYIRADGATDGVLASCSSDEPGTAAGGNRQQNEPSVAVRPGEPSFIVATANDYCTVPSFGDAWEGVYVSTNGGATWTDSLLPGYPGDTSAAGQASPLFGVDTNSGDPLVRWDTSGDLFVGGIAFNRTATTGAVQQANGNAFVATYVRDPKSPLGIAYVRTVIVGIGTPSPFTPFSGRFNDKPSLQVDNWSTSPNRGNVYMAWTLFPGAAGQ